MDFSPLYEQLFSALWFLIPFFVCISFFRSAWFKGLIGEFIVNLLARFQLDQQVYHLLKNVTLKTEDGTTQIDHIIVSVYGVFVMETKNIRGWIFGQPQQKMWTQQIYNHKNQFQNPLHQNYKHIKTLQALLYLEEEQLHSVIVFVGKSEFKTPQPQNVTHGMAYIRHIKSKTELLITPIEKDQIIAAIENGRLTTSFKTNREHISHVQQIVADKESRKPCPLCGNNMVLRQTKIGDHKGKYFWGCSNFPRCRTMLPIDD
ncbi:MAG: nuclease [Gammaproteobacteria bacterium]|nr:MAG: nuclease [Gammaproteobacteria bacterium]